VYVGLAGIFNSDRGYFLCDVMVAVVAVVVVVSIPYPTLQVRRRMVWGEGGKGDGGAEPKGGEGHFGSGSRIS